MAVPVIELTPDPLALMAAFTKAVVATVVELSLVTAVGAAGVPVNVGEAKFAFKVRSGRPVKSE